MTSAAATTSMPPDWARTLTDPQAFQHEQEKLSHVWTFLGLARDVANDGDWFRATLATRSVFVQRFGSDLKAFENRCAHRFFPLRTADKGNGPIVCGFHHWRYDSQGRAVGIPMCKELFGVIPRELDARLKPVEIELCGSFIFGRFPSPDATESLAEFLAESFPILEAMSETTAVPQYLTREVRANWRLCYHTSVEDYHIVAIHPSTFGKGGYLKREAIGYLRFGIHNAYFTTSDPEALTKMAAECQAGNWVSVNYRVFHVFPNLAVAHFRSDAQYWFILVLQYSAVTTDRSVMRAWIYPAPFAANHVWHDRWTRPFTTLSRKLGVRYYVSKVLKEDNDACEQLQSVAHQVHEPPILGGLEERMAWFEEAYAKIVLPGTRKTSEP